MKKRGQMRKNFIEIILLLLLVGLILLAVSSFIINRQEGAVSKGYFNKLVNEINSLESGSTSEGVVIFINPGWFIKGFDKGQRSPKSCEAEACLCICKKGSITTGFRYDCQKKGFCEIFDKNLRLEKDGQHKQVNLQPGGHSIYLKSDGIIILSEKALEEEYKDVEKIKVKHVMDTEDKSMNNVLMAMEYAKKNSIVRRRCYCGDKCKEYAELLVRYSKENGIPDPLLSLSLMMQESECRADAKSGSSYGLMQINLNAQGLPLTWPWYNPETNIKEGLSILKNKYDLLQKGVSIGTCKYDKERKGIIFTGCKRTVFYKDWQAAVRGYNGCGCNPKYPSQDWFVEEVFKRYWQISKFVQTQTT